MKEYRFHDRGVNYILVDTPGFDDTYLSDEDVTTKILTWLESSYRKKSLLNGVLYLHRLSDKRMGGSALSNLRMFRKLCGADALKNVILGTTFWETLSQSDIDIREAELKDPKKDFWAKMVAKGSQIRKISQDRDSCLKIVREIADNHKVVFQVQDDIVNHGVGIAAAAREAVTESQRTQKAFDDDVQVLLEKIRNAKKPSAKKTRPRFDSLDFDILEEEKRWDKDLRDQQQRELRDLERKVQQQDESIKQKKADRLVAETRKKNKALQKNGNCKQHKPPKTSKPRCSVCYSKIGNKGFYRKLLDSLKPRDGPKRLYPSLTFLQIAAYARINVFCNVWIVAISAQMICTQKWN